MDFPIRFTKSGETLKRTHFCATKRNLFRPLEVTISVDLHLSKALFSLDPELITCSSGATN